MSLRLRVLLLVMSVAVVATGTAAWLTLNRTTKEITRTVTADQEQAAMIISDLVDYGQRRGGWGGIDRRVQRVADETGQRIRVLSDSGALIIDSDMIAGGVARPTPVPPIVVDPRPVLQPPEGISEIAMIEGTTNAIGRYRLAVWLAKCLATVNAEVRLTDSYWGISNITPINALDPAVQNCQLRAKQVYTEKNHDIDTEWATACREVRRTEPLDSCLKSVFTRRTGEFAPQPLRVLLGARNADQINVAVWPVAAMAAGVAVLAIVVALLLSRRVLRPVAALTSASRRLGAGGLDERVPVVGRDELAELGRSFNMMADSLQRSEERQRQLVADVAHELRTPLANLRGYLEALRDGIIPASPEVFASLHDEALLQQRIVDDLQDLALAEAGSLAYHRMRVDLVELAEICRHANLASAEAAGVSLTVQASHDVTVLADPDRLRQVLGNLITNALRATYRGGSVTLTVYSVGVSAVIDVRDTGHGIAPEDLPHLFDRFWRADQSRHRGTGGSGLGLAIAKEIVSAQGGTITVESRIGCGSTFTLTLPVADGGRVPVR